MDKQQSDIECVREATLFQFDMAWQLFEYHMTGLENEECMWRSSENGLHVYYKDGLWIADWPTSESYDMGPPSIAWTLWHITFWWSMVFDYSFGQGQQNHETVYWPGSIELSKQKIIEFHDKWRTLLETMPSADFLSTAKTKWPFQDKPFYQLAAWLNLELIKNISEIGSGRFLYASQK